MDGLDNGEVGAGDMEQFRISQKFRVFCQNFCCYFCAFVQLNAHCVLYLGRKFMNKDDDVHFN